MSGAKRLPRATPIHERRHAIIIGAFGRLDNDPGYDALVLESARAVNSRDAVALRDKVNALLDLVSGAEPEFVKVMGRGETAKSLGAIIEAVALGLRAPHLSAEEISAWYERETNTFAATERISPDNPGPPDNPSAPGLTVEQRWEIESYLVSRREAVQPGRKPGSKKPKGSGRKAVDVVQARRALALHRGRTYRAGNCGRGESLA